MEPEEAQFWQFVATGRAHLQRCGTCQVWVHPSAPVCPDCLEPNLVWEALSGEGTVWSYTVYRHSFADHLTARIPYCLVLVELSEGPLLMGNLSATSYGPELIGAPVRLRYSMNDGEPTYSFTRSEGQSTNEE